MAGQWQGGLQPPPVIKVGFQAHPVTPLAPKADANRGARLTQSTRSHSFPHMALPLCYSPSFVVVGETLRSGDTDISGPHPEETSSSEGKASGRGGSGAAT